MFGQSRMAWLVRLMLAAALLGGCGDSSSSSKPTNGTVHLAITDAPVADAVALWITFTSVTLQGVGGTADQGPFAIPDDRQLVNLMEYTGSDRAVLLADLEVPAGTYKLRLDADLTYEGEPPHAYITFPMASAHCGLLPTDGAPLGDPNVCRYPLEIPSEEQAGFRPKGDITVTAGGDSHFTVEFDLRKNLVAPSNPGSLALRLKPTGLRLVDDTRAGGLTGTVALPEGCDPGAARVYLYDLSGLTAGQLAEFSPDDIHDGNTAYVTSADVISDTTDGETTYSYTIGFIPAGDAYAVALTCEAADDPEADETFAFPIMAGGVEVVAEFEVLQDLVLPTAE